ncbi:MAG TPA: hypothetical protein GX745_08535 [Clostridiales bacterium]|nr:hypothetical protein [Clostridiales bacterium]
MAEENVQYSFTGDVSSLKQATEQAIGLLDKYGATMAAAAQTDNFGASKRSATSFNASIKRLTRDVTSLQKKLKDVGDVKLPTGSQPAQALSSTLDVLQNQLQKLNSTEKITTKSLTEMKRALEAVRTSVSGATPQIDKLVASEQRFQKVLGTVQAKAAQFNSKMNDSKTKLAGTFDPVTQRLQSFGARFRTMFDSITPKLQGFKDKAATAFSRVAQLATAVASAFRRVKQGADEDSAAADKNAMAQARLATAWQKLQSEGRSVSSTFTSMGQKAKQVTTAMGKLGQGFKRAVSGIGSFVSKLKESITSLTKFGQSTRQASILTNRLRTAFAGLTAIKVGEWLSKAVTQSIRYVENLNLFTVAMGSAVDSAREFVDKMAETLGLDPSNIMRHAGYFYQLAGAIEMPAESAKILSLSLTRAANDIASLFNVDIEQVTENLAAGMQGMSRAVRKYGIDIRNTTLQTIALRYGLQEKVGAMSEANRQALRYIAIIEQTSKATQQLATDTEGVTRTIGDFARNIETPANQLRIFKEQISQLGRAIGDAFIRPLATAIAYVNGFVMAVRVAIQFITSLFGVSTEGLGGAIDGFEDEADAIDAVGEAADGAAARVKKLLAPFDELNVLSEDTAAAGVGGIGMGEVLDPALAQAIADMELKLDEVRMKAHGVRDSILEFLGFQMDGHEIVSWDSSSFEANLINKFPQWTSTISATFNNWSKIVEGFKRVFASMGAIIRTMKSRLLEFFGIFVNDDTVSGFVENLGSNLERLSDWLTEHESTLANIGLAIMGVITSMKLLSVLGPIVGFFTQFGSALLPLLEIVGPVALAIAGIAAAVYLLYTHSESFAAELGNLWATLLEGLTIVSEPLMNLLTTIGEGMMTLWSDSIQPIIGEIGDALAPVLITLGELWLHLSGILADVFDTIARAWDETLMPVFTAIFDGVSTLIDIFKLLWEEVLGPIFIKIGEGLASLWQSTVKPVFEAVMGVIGGLIELVMALWNNVLGPLVEWIVRALGPPIVSVFGSIWDAVSTVYSNIMRVIEGLLVMFRGLIDFLVGVFTGNWRRALQGLVNILVGIGNSIIGVFELIVNGVIWLINLMISAIFNALVGLINLILGAVEGIADLLGFDLDIRITAKPPEIPPLSIPRIPQMAAGGVVTGPTYALIGEGQYDEAVIPLGDSPQMKELVDKIAEAVRGDGPPADQKVEVHVIIGGKEWDTFTYKSAKRGEVRVGAKPIKAGGY